MNAQNATTDAGTSVVGEARKALGNGERTLPPRVDAVNLGGARW